MGELLVTSRVDGVECQSRRMRAAVGLAPRMLDALGHHHYRDGHCGPLIEDDLRRPRRPLTGSPRSSGSRHQATANNWPPSSVITIIWWLEPLISAEACAVPACSASSYKAFTGPAEVSRHYQCARQTRRGRSNFGGLRADFRSIIIGVFCGVWAPDAAPSETARP